MKIRKVMTRKVDIIYTNNTIQQAAQKMKELNFGELPVADGDKAVGMLTYRDITIRIAAKGLDPKKSKVSDAMTMGIVACKEEDDVDTAAEMMGSYLKIKLACSHFKRFYASYSVIESAN